MAEPDAPELYKKHCAECHVSNRLGRQGPALLPQNLKRLRKKRALRVISKGRPATQMPAFKQTLTVDEIKALSEYIYTPASGDIVWGLDQINASHIQHNREADLSDKPVFKVDDLLNLFHCDNL